MTSTPGSTNVAVSGQQNLAAGRDLYVHIEVGSPALAELIDRLLIPLIARMVADQVRTRLSEGASC